MSSVPFLIYFNEENFERSIVCLKEVIENYPRTVSFSSAKIGLKDAYLQKGSIGEYLLYINKIPQLDISVSAKEIANPAMEIIDPAKEFAAPSKERNALAKEFKAPAKEIMLAAKLLIALSKEFHCPCSGNQNACQ